MATKVGDVFAELRLRSDKAEADIKSFKRELKKTTGELDKGERKTKVFGKSLKDLGRGARVAGGQIAKGIAVGTAAITAAGLAAFTFAKTWAATVDEVGKAAGKFKIPAQELQALEHAADLSGASAQALRKSIQNLNKFITEGEQKGVTPFTEALFQLGLSIDDIKGKTKTEIFGIISDELNKLTDVERKATLQMKLFGEEAGPNLANFTDAGSEGIAKMVKKVEELGGTLTDEALSAAANLNDELADMRVVMSGVSNFIGTRLAPVIQRIVRRFSSWILANKTLIASRLEKFLSASADAAARLLPQFLELATATLAVVEAVGGIEGALQLALGGLLTFKLAFIGAFGAAGPIFAAVAALVTIFAVLDSKIDQSARKIDNLVDKSLATRDVLSTGEFTAEELSKSKAGQEILQLRAEKLALVEKQKGSQKIGERTVEAVRAVQRDPGDASEFASVDQEEQIRDLKSREKLVFERGQKILAIQKKIDKRTDDIRVARLKQLRNEQRQSNKDRARDEVLLTEFRELSKLAIANEATPGQLKRLKILERDLKIKRPTPTKSIFGAAAKEDDEPKTPQQLIQEALGGGGKLNVGGLVPSGPGTTINHNNFSINLAAPDIDIIIKGLPANANAMDVAQRVKDEMRTAIQDTVRISYQTQIQQVVG